MRGFNEFAIILFIPYNRISVTSTSVRVHSFSRCIDLAQFDSDVSIIMRSLIRVALLLIAYAVLDALCRMYAGIDVYPANNMFT